MTGIIDYGCGNLFSLKCSLEFLGEKTEITGADGIERYERLILPGVGAFAGAMQKLRESGLLGAVKTAVEKGVPLLGICLGMQLLYDKSFEYGEHAGLSLLHGEVRPLSEIASGLKIPQIGWNSLRFCKKSKLFRYVNEGEFVYFVHSYRATGEGTVAIVDYGGEVCAAAESGNVYGVQFHPEKSGETGLKILKAFLEI